MAELLITVGEFVWLGYFAALCLFFFLALKNAQINSSLIAMAVTVTITGLTYKFKPLLLAITDEEYKALVRFVWYLGFAVSEILIIYAIYRIHVVFKQTYSIVARVILLSALVKVLLHLTRLTERHFYNTDIFKSLYRWGIVSINISTAAVILSLAMAALYSHYNQKHIRGVL